MTKDLPAVWLDQTCAQPMKIRLTSYDGSIREARIPGTELTAPSVIAWEDKFFALNSYDASLTVKITNDTTLQYRQCRGEHLSNIELVEVGYDL